MSSEFMNMGDPPKKKAEEMAEMARLATSAEKAIENQAKACEAALIAAKAFEKLVSIVDTVAKTWLEKTWR